MWLLLWVNGEEMVNGLHAAPNFPSLTAPISIVCFGSPISSRHNLSPMFASLSFDSFIFLSNIQAIIHSLSVSAAFHLQRNLRQRPHYWSQISERYSRSPQNAKRIQNNAKKHKKNAQNTKPLLPRSRSEQGRPTNKRNDFPPYLRQTKPNLLSWEKDMPPWT